MYKKIIVLIVAMISVTSCYSKKYVMGLYDISKDDKYILFGAFSHNRSSIYRTSIDGSNPIVIISATKEESFWSPMYSEDGKQIVFIGENEEKTNVSSVYIANADGSNITKLVEGNLITQVFFSKYHNEIIYLKANEFRSYSPVGKVMPHVMDIYAVDITSKQVKQLSNLNAYAIYQLSEIDSTTFLMFMPQSKDNESGMIIYSRESSKITGSIQPSNHPRAYPAMYDSPYYSSKYNELVFTAPYELYIMDMKTKIARALYSNVGYGKGKSGEQEGMIESFCLFNTQNRVLFYEEKDTGFCAINADGTGFIRIPIELPR
jgi:hypothetical protein